MLFSPQILTRAGKFPAIGGGGGGLALDASVASIVSSTSTVLPNLSTSGTNRVIIVLVGEHGGTVSGVSGSTLGAFTQRATGNRFSSQYSYAYYKVASSQLTNEVITVTCAGSPAGSAAALAISGANTASPFDPNGALPGIVGAGGGGGSYATVTTTNANTFLYGVIFASNVSVPTGGAGWTKIAGADNFTLVEYQIVSATQAGTQLTSANVIAGDVDTSIADAITA